MGLSLRTTLLRLRRRSRGSTLLQGTFTCTGIIRKVTVDVSGDLIVDDNERDAYNRAHAASIMARV